MKNLLSFFISVIKKIVQGLLLSPVFLSILLCTDTVADVVTEWNAAAVQVMLKAPGAGFIDLVYLHVVMYDAVNAIDRRYTVFAVNPKSSSTWASKEAAASKAAYTVLSNYYPSQSAFLDSIYDNILKTLPDDTLKIRGIQIGEEVAHRYLEIRRNDGRLASVEYTFLNPDAGVYQLTPGSPAPPLTPAIPWLANLTPFSMYSAKQFRPGGPPELTNELYTKDFNEVKIYGSKDTTSTTPEQREIARFYTESPLLQYARILRNFASGRNLSIAENARLFAQLYVAIGDALIAGWDAKFYYNRWRPVTAIHKADMDGNPLTVPDTSWLPLVGTPNHQEYVSTHSCIAGAIAVTLEKFFGTSDIQINFSSTVTGTEHSFSNVEQFVEEIINARVWGGMHFRSSNLDGIKMGREIADWVAEHKFRIAEIPLSGLQMWLKADEGVITHTLIGFVSKWIDQSGNGNDAIQNTPDRQPVYIPYAINEKPLIRFDGWNDKLGFTGSQEISSVSLFLVIKNDSGATGIYPNQILTLGKHYFLRMRSFDQDLPDRISVALGPENAVYGTDQNIAAYNQWRNLSISTHQSIWNTTLRWNGRDAEMVKVGFDETISFPLGDSLGSGGGIGGADNVPFGSIIAKCDVAEIIVYNRVVTDSERTFVENYLTAKYNFITDVLEEETSDIVQNFYLDQNYPNPFNPKTIINFSIPSSGSVSLKIFDVLGKEILNLVNEFKAAGKYTVDFDGSGLSAGIYLYTLKFGKYNQTKKLILLK